MKKVLLGLIAVVVIVLVYTLTKSNTAKAPAVKGVESKQTEQKADRSSNKATQVQTQPQQKAEDVNSNDKKIMELEIKTTQEGTGEAVKAGDTVSVLYTGKLADGTVFDASVKHGNQPFDFQVGAGMVIKGWDQGLLGAKVGEKRTLTIPSDLGYGPQGIPGVIPANATLIFDVEVLSIK